MIGFAFGNVNLLGRTAALQISLQQMRAFQHGLSVRAAGFGLGKQLGQMLELLVLGGGDVFHKGYYSVQTAICAYTIKIGNGRLNTFFQSRTVRQKCANGPCPCPKRQCWPAAIAPCR